MKKARLDGLATTLKVVIAGSVLLAASGAVAATEDELRAKAAALVAQMTVNEKCAQLRNDAPAIPRLGIPAYNYWNEALHGVGRNGRATMFPMPIGMAASFDPALVREVADAIATEGRVKHAASVRLGNGGRCCAGLSFWSPNINIFRDPRWGRGMETWGEDPYLTRDGQGRFQCLAAPADGIRRGWRRAPCARRVFVFGSALNVLNVLRCKG